MSMKMYRSKRRQWRRYVNDKYEKKLMRKQYDGSDDQKTDIESMKNIRTNEMEEAGMKENKANRHEQYNEIMMA